MGEVRYHLEQQVVTLELSNPRRGNALDFAMLADLERLLPQIEQDHSLKLLVLKADAASRHFCTGADIASWSSLTPEQVGPDWIERGNRLFDQLEALPIPTVTLAHGLCLGGGLELALATDLLFATDIAAFAFPELSIGAIPGWKGGQRLSERIGRTRAAQMIFTAERVTAAQALTWGLINGYWPLADFPQHSQQVLASITAHPTVALREGKRLLPLNGHCVDSQEHGRALQACMLAQSMRKED